MVELLILSKILDSTQISEKVELQPNLRHGLLVFFFISFLHKIPALTLILNAVVPGSVEGFAALY